MSSTRRVLPMIVAFCLLVSMVSYPLYAVQNRLDAFRSKQTASESIQYLPSGKFLSTAVLGFDNFTADLLWVRGIALFGEQFKLTSDNQWFNWLFQLINLASDLDPRDVRIYKYGGLMLRLGPNVDQSTFIFAKGMNAIPDEYYMPFGIAMNYLEQKKDNEKAAEYMRNAASRKNAPFFLRNLAASLMDQTDQQSAALKFLEEELVELKPGSLQHNAVTVKILEIKHDKAARQLHRAVGEFLSIYNRMPTSLKEIEGKTWRGPLPEDPYGGQFIIDPSRGVRSSRYEEMREIFRTQYGLGYKKKEDATGP